MFVHDFVRLNLPCGEAVSRFGANVDPWLGLLVASAALIAYTLRRERRTKKAGSGAAS